MFFSDLILSDKKNNLTKREIMVRGTIIAVIITIPSLIAFVLIWIAFDDLILGAIISAVIHFIAMGFSLKIAKKFLVKKL